MVQGKESSFIKFIRGRYILIIFVVFSIIFLGIIVSRTRLFLAEQKIFPREVEYVQDEIIVKYRQGQSQNELKTAGQLEQRQKLLDTLSQIVAVIDTGVDYNHDDLKGLVIKGKNFIDNSDDPMDDQGHGTHVTGILGAVTNNGIGVSGISWGARILA